MAAASTRLISFKNEQVIPFSEVAQHFAFLNGGSGPHLVTVHRWASRGVRGRILESIRVGGRKCTSLEALQRFVDALSDPATAETPRQLTARRQAEISKANRELEALGV